MPNYTPEQASRRASALLELAERCAPTSQGRCRVADVTLHHEGYAEPGYDNPASGIVALGDWNDISTYQDGKWVSEDNTLCRLGAMLEKLGVALEWNDEWTTCDDCGKLIRTSPNSYCWKFSGWQSDDGCVCSECVMKDPEDYLENMEGETTRAVTLEIDPAKHGYTQLEGWFEHGLYGGQNADPKVIAKSLKKLGVTRFLFVLDDVGQFDARFSVYVHDSEMENLDRGKWAAAETDGPDLVAGLERALSAASTEMAKLPEGQGIKYAKVKADGTAEVKLVSPQDFIDGTLK
jgi:hypothetical protein